MNIQPQVKYDELTAMAILQQNTLISTDDNFTKDSVLTLKTRFGDITVDTNKAMTFPSGLLGMPDKQRFALAQFQNPKMEQFKLLQSLDDHSLSFITLPLDVENTIVSSADLRAAANDLQIKEESLAVLLIVSVHRNPEQVKLSVNARAPIFVDAERKIAVQYVFQHDGYKVQHMLA